MKILYEAPIWSEAVNILYRKVEIEEIQRKAIVRRVCIYHTESKSRRNVCVLAHVSPLEFRWYVTQ